MLSDVCSNERQRYFYLCFSSGFSSETSYLNLEKKQKLRSVDSRTRGTSSFSSYPSAQPRSRSLLIVVDHPNLLQGTVYRNYEYVCWSRIDVFWQKIRIHFAMLVDPNTQLSLDT